MSAKKDVIYGINAVQDLIIHNAKLIEALYVDQSRDDKRIASLKKNADRNSLRYRILPSKAFEAEIQQYESIKPSLHQGVFALARSLESKDENFLKKLVDNTSSPLLLVLDGITDPHNLGACLRSANAAGAVAVVVPKDKAVGLTAVVRKVASGAAEVTPLVVVTNLARTLKAIQQQGVWVMGAAGEADSTLYDLDLKGGIAIVIGSEGEGLRRLTRENCDNLFKIPMVGTVESLNASVAAAVSLFEAKRQRA